MSTYPLAQPGDCDAQTKFVGSPRVRPERNQPESARPGDSDLLLRQPGLFVRSNGLRADNPAHRPDTQSKRAGQGPEPIRFGRAAGQFTPHGRKSEFKVIVDLDELEQFTPYCRKPSQSNRIRPLVEDRTLHSLTDRKNASRNLGTEQPLNRPEFLSLNLQSGSQLLGGGLPERTFVSGDEQCAARQRSDNQRRKQHCPETPDSKVSPHLADACLSQDRIQCIPHFMYTY